MASCNVTMYRGATVAFQVAYVGGRTPDGRQERLMFTASPNDTQQKDSAPLCRDTEAVAARFLGTAGLP